MSFLHVFQLKHHLMNHLQSHTGERPFQCDRCVKRFSLRSRLLEHLRKHDNPHRCDRCDETFVYAKKFEMHMRSHVDPQLCATSVEVSYVCSMCPKQFAKPYYLVKHERTHTGERPFSCAVCNKAFAQNGDLVKHSLIHSDQRPFVCATCGKAFRVIAV